MANIERLALSLPTLTNLRLLSFCTYFFTLLNPTHLSWSLHELKDISHGRLEELKLILHLHPGAPNESKWGEDGAWAELDSIFKTGFSSMRSVDVTIIDRDVSESGSPQINLAKQRMPIIDGRGILSLQVSSHSPDMWQHLIAT